MFVCDCISVWTCVPLAILARQVVLPEHNLPRTQAFRVKWGNEVEVSSTAGGWTMFLTRRTTCPRKLLLVGGDLVSPASSGHVHSPTMFWDTSYCQDKEVLQHSDTSRLPFRHNSNIFSANRCCSVSFHLSLSNYTWYWQWYQLLCDNVGFFLTQKT